MQTGGARLRTLSARIPFRRTKREYLILTDLRVRPSAVALSMLRDALAPGGRVGRLRRLRGGVSRGMHAVELFGSDGRPRWIVIRRYGDYWLDNDPAVCVREWRVLQLLQRENLPTALPLWLDARGEAFGRPTLTTTLLNGRRQLGLPGGPGHGPRSATGMRSPVC
jgi:hypothetical protein